MAINQQNTDSMNLENVPTLTEPEPLHAPLDSSTPPLGPTTQLAIAKSFSHEPNPNHNNNRNNHKSNNNGYNNMNNNNHNNSNKKTNNRARIKSTSYVPKRRRKEIQQKLEDGYNLKTCSCSVCGCYRIDCTHTLRDMIMFLRSTIIFAIITSYIGFSLLDYYNTDVNRTESSREELLDALPKPFVYISHPSRYNCFMFRLNISNTTTFSIIWESFHDAEDLDADSGITMDYILTNESYDEFFIIRDTESNENFNQYLIIPPSIESSYTNAANFESALSVSLLCDIGNYPKIVNDSQLINLVIDNKEVLHEFSNVTQIFNTYLGTYTSSVTVGSFILYNYEWSIINNKIKNERKSFYTPNIEYEITLPNEYISFGVSSIISILPFYRAIKKTYTITQATTIVDILSDVGGLFSSVYSTITVIAFALIWGTRYCNCTFFNGLDNQADPSSMDQRMYKPFIARVARNEIELKMKSMEDEMKKMRQMLFEYRIAAESTNGNSDHFHYQNTANISDVDTIGDSQPETLV